MKYLRESAEQDASSESGFMPMVDLLLVLLSLFFIAFVILSFPEPERTPDPIIPPPFSLSSDRYFNSGEFVLAPVYLNELRTVLQDSLINRYELLRDQGLLGSLKFIIIEGHADRQPYPSRFYGIRTGMTGIDGNDELSYFRAYTIYLELQNIMRNNHLFVSHRDRIIVAGAGSRRPVNKRGAIVAAEDRRIEVHFIFDEKEVN